MCVTRVGQVLYVQKAFIAAIHTGTGGLNTNTVQETAYRILEDSPGTVP